MSKTAEQAKNKGVQVTIVFSKEGSQMHRLMQAMEKVRNA